MIFKLPVSVVVIAPDGSLLERSVHPLDLAIGPWMVGLGEAMLDVVLAADAIEHVQPVAGRRTRAVLNAVAELDAVVGEDGMYLVGHRPDHRRQESAAVFTLATECNWAKAYFDVRSIATKRWSLPSSVRTSAMSRWK